jgi:spore coat polysaccharide biosynthesis protein SpsF
VSKVIGVITARMASTRLPGKVLKPLAGKSIFAHVAERMAAIEELDGVFLATSMDPANAELIAEAERFGYGHYSGAEQDVVDRHIQLARRENADAVIRVTCDCPLFSIESASRYVAEFKARHRDFIYVSNFAAIYGTLGELLSLKALEEVHRHYRGPAISMHVRENMDQFDTLGLEIDPDLCRPEYRLTVDEPLDYELMANIYDALYDNAPLDLRKVYAWLDDNPDIAHLNANVAMTGVNVRAANLNEKPLYSIVASGSKYAILDQQKRFVDPSQFLEKLKTMFPDLD